jgi:hypothetical protein
MAKRSFTPGPWIAEEVGVTDMGPDGIAVFEVRTADGHKRICEYMGDGDAQLIAAAPQMLAALQALSDALPSDEYMRAQGQEPGPGLVAMRAAIAAATGSAE